MRFDELDLGDDLLDALDAMMFEECTPIQEQSIGIVLDGHDLIACAQTGTGKTAAYLLPVIDLISRGGYPTDAINCVIMVPTHELAQQIDQQLEGFAYYVDISGLAIHGGTDGKEFARQQKALISGADIVIATPGRLLAHMKMGYVDLSQVGFFILDEADRMLDMGFSDDIMQIYKQLPEEKQTLMYSATMPPKIQQLARTILRNPKEVKIAVSKPTEKIDQSAVICHEEQKTPVLRYLLDHYGGKRVIVFAASKLKVKEITRSLRQAGYKAAEMHSDLDQQQREEVILSFRAGRTDLIIATDILARGIDIDEIAMVVNYDVPREAEDYVHRIGRTARANNDGKAVTLVGGRDRRKFGYIERFLGYKVRREELPAELGIIPEEKSDSAPSTDKKRRPTRKGRNRKPRNSTPKESSAPTSSPDAPQVKKRSGNHRRHRKPADRNNNSQKPQ